MSGTDKPRPDQRAHLAHETRSPETAHEQAVLKAIRETSYGTIEVTVHQSKIVQITRSEKLRL